MNNKELVIACQTCGYLIKDIANAFIDVGYDVVIMTSPYSQSNIKDSVKKGVRLSTVINYDRSSSLKRIITWTICAIQMLFKIGFLYRKSKILYVSNPPISPLLPLLLGNKYNVLIWDIYPDVLVRQRVIGKSNVITKLWGRANTKVYNKAGHVFTIGEGMKECLSKYVNKEKIKVIPLWSDSSNLQKIKKADNLFIKKYQFEGKFIVMYSGNMGNTHKMDVLIDVAKLIDDRDVLFLLIGEGGKKKMIENRIKNEEVKNVIQLPYQPYDFLSHSLCAADLAVITLDSESSQMSVPSKTFNMMSLGVPLLCIAPPESELGSIVKKYNIGGVFYPEEVEQIANFIVTLKQNDIYRMEFAENSLNASQKYSVGNAKEYLD